MAAGINGSTILVQVRTATGPDVYTTLGGQRGLSIERTRTIIETSAKDDADATKLGGRRDSKVSLDGIVIAGDAGRTALLAAHNGDGSCRIRVTPIGTETAVQAIGIISSLTQEFPDDEESTYSLDIEVTGAWGPAI